MSHAAEVLADNPTYWTRFADLARVVQLPKERRNQSMATEIPELDAFYKFAQRKLRDDGAETSLEEVLREFREEENWTPRTPLGEQLQELRRQFIAEGGELLTADEVAAEVRERRGKHFTEE